MDKKGTYIMSLSMDGQTETASGTWNFTSGVGELKNKSQITIYDLNYTSSSGTYTYTGNYVDRAFDLVELRNKKMVWYSKVTYTNPSGSSTSEEKYVWEAK
jgi:hypothetical protein